MLRRVEIRVVNVDGGFSVLFLVEIRCASSYSCVKVEKLYGDLYPLPHLDLKGCVIWGSSELFWWRCMAIASRVTNPIRDTGWATSAFLMIFIILAMAVKQSTCNVVRLGAVMY
jgi:hypothetical protein